MEHVLAIRRAVFVNEQGVDEEIEMDGLDPLCRHYLLWADGEPAATLRVRRVGNVTKLERMAVLRGFRRQGIGSALLEHVVADYRREPSGNSFVLHAQEAAVEFYARFGFSPEGQGFEEAGIPHRRMVRPA